MENLIKELHKKDEKMLQEHKEKQKRIKEEANEIIIKKHDNKNILDSELYDIAEMLWEKYYPNALNKDEYVSIVYLIRKEVLFQ